MEVGPALETEVRKAGLVTLRRFLAANDILSFPRRPNGSPMLLRQGFFERLLRKEVDFPSCPASDLVAAQADIRHLSLPQLLHIRCDNIECQASACAQAQSKFLACIDERIEQCIFQKLSCTPNLAPQISKAKIHEFVHLAVLIYGVYGDLLPGGEDDHKSTFWLLRFESFSAVLCLTTCELLPLEGADGPAYWHQNLSRSTSTAAKAKKRVHWKVELSTDLGSIPAAPQQARRRKTSHHESAEHASTRTEAEDSPKMPSVIDDQGRALCDAVEKASDETDALQTPCIENSRKVGSDVAINTTTSSVDELPPFSGESITEGICLAMCTENRDSQDIMEQTNDQDTCALIETVAQDADLDLRSTNLGLNASNSGSFETDTVQTPSIENHHKVGSDAAIHATASSVDELSLVNGESITELSCLAKCTENRGCLEKCTEICASQDTLVQTNDLDTSALTETVAQNADLDSRSTNLAIHASNSGSVETDTVQTPSIENQHNVESDMAIHATTSSVDELSSISGEGITELSCLAICTENRGSQDLSEQASDLDTSSLIETTPQHAFQDSLERMSDLGPASLAESAPGILEVITSADSMSHSFQTSSESRNQSASHVCHTDSLTSPRDTSQAVASEICPSGVTSTTCSSPRSVSQDRKEPQLSFSDPAYVAELEQELQNLRAKLAVSEESRKALEGQLRTTNGFTQLVDAAEPGACAVEFDISCGDMPDENHELDKLFECRGTAHLFNCSKDSKLLARGKIKASRSFLKKIKSSLSTSKKSRSIS